MKIHADYHPLQHPQLSGCPDQQTLSQMLSETWTVDEKLCQHIEACGQCQQVLDQLSDSGLLADYRPWGSRIGEQLPAMEPPQQPGELGRLGDLAIHSVLGRGGMGIVLRGRDLRLGRDVAVKFVRSGSSVEIEQRFVREARAVAAMHHENIVPIFHVGQNPAGREYIVSPLIQGPTLRKRLESGDLEPQKTAELIRQIADALASAHAAGLVHRDVKPANILLDEVDSRAKITDFGLVRVAEANTLTQADMLCGTPEYMSPEQAAHGDKIDHRSDIYSLGVTLYECLTGTPPFRGRPLEVIDQHRDTSPLSPRRLNRLVPAELEIICLKAMAKEPESRYQSMAELRDDLQRFLNGQPILARPVPPSQRLRLWCRRNPRLALALASTIGSLLLGTSVSTVLWLQSATNARQAMSLADELSVKQQELTSALQTSETQRLQAEKRFAELRKLANELLFEIYPQIEFLENSLAARQAIVTSALSYLDSLSEESHDDLELQAELASAYEKVGELYGVIGNSHFGDKQAGLGNYLKAQQIRQAVFDADPTDPRSNERLAHNHYVIARTLWTNDEIQEAELAFQKSIQLQRAVCEAESQSEDKLNKLATILIDYANVPVWEGQYDFANELFDEAQQILDNLIERNPENGEYKKTVTRLLRAVSRVYGNTGDPEASETALLKAIAIGIDLLALYPDDFSVARSVWISQHLLGELYIKHRVMDKLVLACQESLAFPKSVMEREPDNWFVAVDLANSHFNLARAYRLTDQYEAAIEEAQNAAAVTQRLLASHPQDKEYQRNLAIQLTEVARGLLELNQYAEVLEPAQQAIDILEELVSQRSGSNFNKYDLSIAHRVAAQANHYLGNRDQAIGSINRAITLITELRDADILESADELMQELIDERQMFENQ